MSQAQLRAAFVAAQSPSGAATFQSFRALLTSPAVASVAARGVAFTEDEEEAALLRVYERALDASAAMLGEETDVILPEAFTHACHEHGLIDARCVP